MLGLSSPKRLTARQPASPKSRSENMPTAAICPVPFLEGIWVKEPLRRQGIGGRLIRHVAALIAANGFHELGSDALIDNIAAHAAHAAWGFSETERVVYFRKHLTAPNR